MKLNDLYGGVPENVSQRIQNTVSGLPEKQANERGIRLSRPLTIALSCVLAVVLMTATAFTVGLLTDREEREQRFVDPYAEQVMDSATQNGITMTINKIAMDFNTDYVYFTLKNENGVFEKQPEFDEISYTSRDHNAAGDNPDIRDPDDGELYHFDPSWNIETKFGSPCGYTALSSSDYDPENPSDTIHAVLRSRLPYGKMTLDFKGLKSTDGSIEYAKSFSFDIDIGTNRQVIDDIIQHGFFDEEDVNNEFKKYDKKSEVLNYMITEPNNTIEIEGNKLTVTQLYISPYQVSVTLEDDLSRTVKVGELEYYPHTLVTMTTEYLRQSKANKELREKMTPEERAEYTFVEYSHGENRTKFENDFTIADFMERNRIQREEGEQALRDYMSKGAGVYTFTEEGRRILNIKENPEYWELMDDARYKIGVEFAPGVEAKQVGWDNGGAYYKVEEKREDCRMYATVDFEIDRAVSMDEIVRVYFYKYSDPSVQVDVWVNK